MNRLSVILRDPKHLSLDRQSKAKPVVELFAMVACLVCPHVMLQLRELSDTSGAVRRCPAKANPDNNKQPAINVELSRVVWPYVALGTHKNLCRCRSI